MLATTKLVSYSIHSQVERDNVDRQHTVHDKVEKVVVSNRLADFPCVLVTGEYGWSSSQHGTYHEGLKTS